MVSEDELEIPDDFEDEPQAQTPAPAAAPDGEPADSNASAPEGGTAPDPRIAEMQAKIAELASRSNGNDELLALGRQFLANQTATQSRPDPNAGAADLAAFGKAFQEAMILGKPEDAGALFLQAVEALTDRKVNAALQTHGTPLAEKAGDYAFSTYLASKRDEVGVNGEKLHKAVTKELKLQPNERAWIAQAPPQQVRHFLDSKYEQAAGRVLLASSSRARPRDISGGGSGGAASAASVFPGLNPAQQRQVERLAERFWPDPAVRATKIKTLAAQMAAGE